MKKFNLKDNFRKSIFLIVTSSLAVSIFSYIIFDTLSKPRLQNKIQVLIGADVKNKKGFDEYFLDACNDDIYTVDSTFLDASQNLFTSYYSTTIDSLDLSILPSSLFDKNIFNISKYFSLSEELLKDKTGLTDFSYFSKDEKNYGIKIYDKATKKGYLKDYIDYSDDDYYLFINKSSYHVGELNKKNDTSNACFDIIKEIYTYEEK